MGHEFRSIEERRAAIVALTQKETGMHTRSMSGV